MYSNFNIDHKGYLLPLLILAFCAVSSIPAKGQDSTLYKAWYVGAVGGAGYYSTIFNPGLPNNADGGGVAPVFGIAARLESPERKSIEVEIRYRKGGWKEFDAYERNMHFLEMPVMGHVAFGRGKFKPFFTLGETLTYIMSEQEMLKDPNYTPVFFNKPVNNKWGFALNGGLGLLMTTEKSLLQLEFRATFQVTNIYRPDDEEIMELGLQNSFPLFIEANLKYLFKVR